MLGVYHNLPTSCALLDFCTVCGAVKMEHPPNTRQSGMLTGKLFEQSLWISSVVEQHCQGCTIEISFTYAPNVHHYTYKGTERDVGIMQ